MEKNIKNERNSMKKKKRIGEFLVEAGKVTQEQVNEALEIQKQTKEKLGEILVGQGIISQEEINEAVERQTGIKTIDLEKYIYLGDAYKLIPEKLAKKYKAIPLKKEQMVITVAMVDPFDIFALEFFLLGIILIF